MKRAITGAEMRSLKNSILHGLFLLVYAPFKNTAFPFFNHIRASILKLFGASLGSSAIADGVMIWFPWRVKIGERSSLNTGVIIDGTGEVEIGLGVRIAPYVCIHTADHAFSDPTVLIVDQGFVLDRVVIEDDVWVGAAVQITKGVRIGKGSVIGCGAVVTQDIPPYSIAVGVPAKVVSSRK